MKFCYVDESGYGSEPILVISGIVVDARRMHITKYEWSGLLKYLSKRINRPIEELHSRHFYRGNGIWRELDDKERTAFINFVLEWLKERKHSIFFSAIDKKLFNNYDWNKDPRFTTKDRPKIWSLCALHLSLSLQKAYQNEGVKGSTVLIFDREVQEEDVFINLILNPLPWTDSFYNNKGKNRLNCIVDVPYFVSSKYVGLINIPDLLSYLIRHFAELKEGYRSPMKTMKNFGGLNVH